jgi:hypothetical protein
MRRMQVLYEGTGVYQERSPHRVRSLNWRLRSVLLWGKLRRFYLIRFRPAYVEASRKRRVGECHRTGACCNLLFTCPVLGMAEKTPSCGIYQRRPGNCTTFPIDERDLHDRNIMNPWEPCGFSFSSDGDAPRTESAFDA